ncbi:Aromatic-L-amino-acid/L-histidine decarboxylase [Handroanthus impetiginosus]|uniref:Aromatic-L-amino-acid/L-histidine decarboxylase n=1 Tax=Handroanthus impetiginosus TaxID=429701 RepID=A0A2G9HY44_9LAMI|nr:Aromatic-L-amino-acid/L-histidine decarboxylase [Handroanthus impetiginosus]
MGSPWNQYNTDNALAETIKPLDPEEFRRQGHLVIDFLADYYKNVEKYPVRSQVEPGYLKKRMPESAPHDPEPIEEILRDVQKDIVPGITHWQSPNYYAYFPSSGSIAGFLGEMLSTGFNIVGFNWMSSPAATELESIVMEWLGKMLKLPVEFLFSGGGGGVLQGTTCEAILCTLVAARDQMLKKIGRDNLKKLVVYGSDQTHSALQKAAQIAGISPINFRAIKTTKENAFGLTAEAFRATVGSDIESGLVPLFLCATIGTTSSTAVDQLSPLCEVAKEYGIWVHVDAAYAGSVFICPEFRHLLDGVENANSFSFNAHKWFLTTLDCCCLWVKDPSALVEALSTYPEYLRNKASETNQVVDYKDWQITLSRRFRSLKLWLVLRSYGVNNLRKFLRGHVKMAQNFEGLIGMDKRFEVVVPRNFATVCFRITPVEICRKHQKVSMEEAANNFNAKLLEFINESGKIYMTHAVIGGIYVMRFAVGASLTENRHVSLAWKVVQEHASTLLMAP